MKMTLRDFFKKGELWSGLEEVIESINKRLALLAKHARESSNREMFFMQHIKQLKAENLEQKDRIHRIEERLWDLNIVSNSNKESIVKEISFKPTKDLGL